ncbi:MAG: LLM class F420-dependent oxidoreductase [Gammaproteobacteria bacterium]
MKLGLVLGLLGQNPEAQIQMAVEAERLGYDSVWFGEIYGSDCFTPLTWIGALTSRIKLGTSIMQISARTPASAAMTAVTLDMLSKGRLLLGIGVSGPQVVEGWYGQPYPRPLERTREWIEIFRRIVAREGPVEFHGRHYDLPHPGGMHLGKPLKLMVHPLRPRIPLYLGAEGPKNVALSAELCDGWVPMFISPDRMGVYDEALAQRPAHFDIAATVPVHINDDPVRARAPVKNLVGFYVGGMGARDVNLHKNHVARLGFGDAAEQIQSLFMSGRRDEAYAAVPDQLVDEISLCGSKARIRERIQDWKKSPVTSLLVSVRDLDSLRFMAEAVL